MNFTKHLVTTIAASVLTISSVAEETAVAFDFEDLQAQSAAQEDKVEKARTVLHEIFSGYCVEKLVSASVNIRDDGRPDVEVDSDTKDFKIRFKLAVKEDALNNWIASSQAKLAQIADKVEDCDGKNVIKEDECIWDNKKYTFDKRIQFRYCVKMFTPTMDNMFRFEIISKTGETLFAGRPFFLKERDNYRNKWGNPLPEGLPSAGTHDVYTPFLNLGECDFLPIIKEIRCSYGRFDDLKFPEMEKAHPVVQVPLKYGVSIDMVEVSPGMYCSKLPFTEEQAFACGIGTEDKNDEGWMRCIFCYRRVGLEKALAAINATAKESGWTFRLPLETEWAYAAKGGSDKEATFGKLPNGEDQMYSAPGWVWDGYDTWGEPKKFVRSANWPLKQKMPNAYGLYDMVGLYPELCIAEEGKYGKMRRYPGEKYCERISVFEWEPDTRINSGTDRQGFSTEWENPNFSLRLFATKH